MYQRINGAGMTSFRNSWVKIGQEEKGISGVALIDRLQETPTGHRVKKFGFAGRTKKTTPDSHPGWKIKGKPILKHIEFSGTRFETEKLWGFYNGSTE